MSFGIERGFSRIWTVAATALTLTLTAAPAAWRSALFPEDWHPPTASTANFATDKFLQDFSYAGYHNGEAPIPQVAGPEFNVTAAPFLGDSTGTQDSTAAIQAAIDAAQTAGGGVVFLPAGTYRVSPPAGKDYALRISASKIVLRGAGANLTRVLNTSTNMRGKSIIVVEASSPLDWRTTGAESAFTADLNGPATTLPVAAPATFAVGDWVSVRSDATDAWMTEHNEDGWIGRGGELGGLAYLRKVTAVDATSITVDIPTRYALKTRDNARVVKLTPPLQEIGLEKFAIGNVQNPGATGWGGNDYLVEGTAAYSCHASYAIRLTGLANSWLRSVESFAASANTSTAHFLSNGVRLDFCRSVTLANCTFQRPQYGGAGGNGYAYRFESSGDNLVTDCTASFARHGYLFSGMATSGNVLYHCTDRQTARYTGPSGSVVAEGRGSEHHAHFSHSNLIDSCTADSSLFLAVYRPFGTDPKHNLTAAHTVFWNTLGRGDPEWEGAVGNVVVASQQSRYGYVIGTRGTRDRVDVSVYYGSSASAAKTAPIDFVEGVGQGTDLVPASLFEDQVTRRLSRAIFRVSAGASSTLTAPPNPLNLRASVTNGPPEAFVPGAVAYTWSVFRAAGPTSLGPSSAQNTTAKFTTPGLYEFRVDATWNGETASDAIVCDLRDSTEALRSIERLAVKDATVRNSEPYASTAYGTEKALQMKFSDTPSVQREILLQFVPVAVSADDLEAATLLLSATNLPNGYTGSIDLLSDVAWNEYATTWNNQPTAGNFTADWTGADGVNPAIDLTSVLKKLLRSGATSFSLRLRATTPTSGDGVIAFRSKEGSSTAGPRLRMVIRGGALPATGTPPKLKILTRSARLVARKKVVIRGTVESATAITSFTLTVKREKPVRCRLDGNGRKWTARVVLRRGKNQVLASASNAAGLSATATGKVKAIRKL